MVPIGQASEQSGVHIETIRYYEREGIIPPPGRAANGRRLFTPEDIARLRFIQRCRGLGFAIADIRALMSLNAHADAPCGEIGAIGRAQLDKLRARMVEMAKLEAALAELVAQCGEGRVACPMLDQLMQA